MFFMPFTLLGSLSSWNLNPQGKYPPDFKYKGHNDFAHTPAVLPPTPPYASLLYSSTLNQIPLSTLVFIYMSINLS